MRNRFRRLAYHLALAGLLVCPCLAQESRACSGQVSVKKSWWQQDSYCVLFRIKVENCSQPGHRVEGTYSFQLQATLRSAEPWGSGEIKDSFSSFDYNTSLRGFLRESCFMFHGQGTPLHEQVRVIESRAAKVTSCQCHTMPATPDAAAQ